VTILVVLTVLRQSRRDPGIPGLGIRQSRIPGLKIQVRDCNPYRQLLLEEKSAPQRKSRLRLWICPAPLEKMLRAAVHVTLWEETMCKMLTLKTPSRCCSCELCEASMTANALKIHGTPRRTNIVHAPHRRVQWLRFSVDDKRSIHSTRQTFRYKPLEPTCWKL